MDKKERYEKYRKYREDYNRDKYDRIMLRVFKGEKEKIKALADSQGISLNSLIYEALQKEIDRIKKRESQR